MKFDSIQRNWLTGITAGICLSLTPFVVFIRHQGYFILRPEILMCFAALIALGLVFGVLMEGGGRLSRAPVFAFLIAVTFDIQLTDPHPVLLWVVFGATLIAGWFIRGRFWRITAAVLAIMLGASFFSPAAHKSVWTQNNIEATDKDESLPVFLHLILDEHIGVEGIPREFDRNGYHAENLRDAYADRGFRVFGRAYSQYYNTWVSLPHVFNFDHTAGTDYAIQRTRKGTKGFRITKNRYLKRMRRKGYRIHVYQTEFLGYCEVEDVPIASCYTYGLESLSSIEHSGMSTGDKLRMISGVYSRLSKIMVDLRVPPARLSSLSAMGALGRLQDDLLNATPGDMFFVHLMLPHYPYAYDEDCTMRGDPWSWLYSYDADMEPLKNDLESRADRYPPYLDQVACTTKRLGQMFDTLDEAGLFEDMTILIHSDHGSRISLRVPHLTATGNRLREEDTIDCFSTFFTVKAPGIAPGYDRRMLPLGPLFEQVVKHGRVPLGTEWAGEQRVYLKRSKDPSVIRPMPDFRRRFSPYTPER